MRSSTIDYYGFLITDDVARIMAKKVVDKITESDDCKDILFEANICAFISCFTGEAVCIDDNGHDAYNLFNLKTCEEFLCDTVYFIPAKSQSTLFKAAYKDMDELISEFKSEIGKYLPDDFDYRSNIRHIAGECEVRFL